MSDQQALFATPDPIQGITNAMRTQGIHVGINNRCAVDGEGWPCSHERAKVTIPNRAHARRTDPVTSDRTVKSLAQEGTYSSLIWLHAQALRHEDMLMNDTELTAWLEKALCKRVQRNVVARARGLMEDAGLLRQAGIFVYEGRELMHYEIDPTNPKEHP